MPLDQTEAIVLRTFNIGDQDKVVVFFSREKGLLRGVAKGARKFGNRFGSSLEPMSLVRVFYYEKERHELVTVSQTDLIESFFEVQGDFPVVFDKTGTLTEGRFGVTDVVALDGGDEEDLLRLAASLESRSEHPIAAGIVRAAEERRLRYPIPEGVRTIPGKGAEARVGGIAVRVVSPGYLVEQRIPVADARVARLAEQGKTVVYVLRDDAVAGAIALADVIRPESREALAWLRARGVKVMMLTGDATPVARWVAGELGLDEFFAQVLPDQKAGTIRAIKARGLTVALLLRWLVLVVRGIGCPVWHSPRV